MSICECSHCTTYRRCRCVISYRILFPCVCILFTGSIVLRKIILGNCPAVCFVECYRLTEVLAVLLQMYCYRCRTLAILIVAVVPDLLHCRLCSLRRDIKGVRDRGRSCILCICCIVVCYCSFLPLVCDRLAVLIYREIRNILRPAVCCIQCELIDLCTIRIEFYCYRIRIVRRSVCLMLPYLLNCQSSLLCLMCICDRCHASAYRRCCCVISYRILFPCIYILIIGRIVLREIILGNCPAVCFVECYRLTEVLAVLL